MNLAEADEDRARLEQELRERQQEMKLAVHDLSATVQRAASTPELLYRTMPYLPYLAAIAAGGYLLLRLRGRGPRLAKVLPAAIGLWRTGLAVRRLLIPAPQPTLHPEPVR